MTFSNCDFIAEVSSNHNQDLPRCLRFIDAAADAGCQGVKFQLFTVDQLFAPEILQRSETHRQRKQWELPVSFLPALADRCRERGLLFSCTPFYLEAVAELAPYVDFYKIASYELLWNDLLISCARTGKPVVLSTGMANMQEIAAAVTVLRDNGCQDLTLLHCVSGYPTPAEQCNLAAMQTMREAFECPIGWSDHSVSPSVLFRAVHHWNARMIEFHLDLEGEGVEFQAGHCWLPDMIGDAIKLIREGFKADGSGRKEPASCETDDRDWRADPEDGLRPLRKIRNTL